MHAKPRQRSDFDVSTLPPAIGFFCGQLARVTGAHPESVLNAVLCGCLAAAGSHVGVAAPPVRTHPSIVIAEIASDRSSQLRAASLVATALNAAANSSSSRRSVAIQDFGWDRLPAALKVRRAGPVCFVRVYQFSRFQEAGGSVAVFNGEFLASSLDNSGNQRFDRSLAHTVIDGGPLLRSAASGGKMYLDATSISVRGVFEVRERRMCPSYDAGDLRVTRLFQ
jgi:hypothetical protein